ncbi:zinc ABC transporter substrate-binding protein [Halorhodospira neutriphila]|uniref:High-affinity zinc uptake system protein ZnuA n=1 Tax=Halorhodospira neutriphila TaxID=168379 RepID=A0ABS1E7U7_9GAMM|nr:zinc ABC transporter substrate-binding protein [Halorhodospira neutriphila]MBK1727264.1 hypothetical protein [Halorhodospira neutriphila]
MRYATLAALLALALAAAAPAQAAPRVVASILPLHALAAGVTAGVSEPRLLLDPEDSPHTYTMRPSEARAVRSADLLLYISPHLESFLQPAVEALGDDAAVLAAAELDGVQLLPARRGEAGHGHRAPAHGEERAPHQQDYHLWLNPANARAIVAALAEALAELDPAHAAAYRANAEALRERLAELDARLRERLAPVRETPYVVFHDAYQHFERRYGLNAVGAVTLHPEQPPGARHLAELRRRIRELGAVCVFSEPQFQPAIVRSLVRGLDVRAGELDPIGSRLEPGPDAYFRLLEGLAEGFRDCLAAP